MRPAIALAIIFSLLSLPASVAAAQPALTKTPVLLHFVEATYPEAARAAGREATVILSIDIGADGRVNDAVVTQSAGEDFDAAALAAARQFVFAPAEVDGHAAPVRIAYRYAFVLRHESSLRKPQVNFDGVVLDRFTKAPVAGVRVLLKDLDRATTTDAHGHFELTDVAPGEHRIELSGGGLITVATDEPISAGARRTVRYLVEQQPSSNGAGADEEEVVRAPRVRKEAIVTAIRAEEARRVPGTQGDTLKVIQDLPGVGRAAFGSGQLVVWGAAPNDTRVVVDGVDVPSLYHLGGLRSTVNSDLVRAVELVPGAYGADYGRGLGGLVRVETRSLPSEGVHGYIGADVLDASALISAAIGKRLRIAVAGRYSYLAQLLGGVVAPDVGDFFPIPRYDDYQVKATLALRSDEELTATLLTSDDALTRTLPAPDPAAARSDTTTQTSYRAMLRYSRILPDRSSVEVTPFFGFDRNDFTQTFGSTSARQDSTAYDYGLRASYRHRVVDRLTMSVGLDWLGTKSNLVRSGSLSVPPREGDVYVFGQPPGSDVNADTWSTHIADLAPYAYAELRLGRFTLTPGLRLDAVMIQGDRSTPVTGNAPTIGYSRLAWDLDPRLSISYRVVERLSLTVAGGIFHQAPAPEDLSAVFGSPTLGLSRAIHVSLAADVRLARSLTAQVVGFYKYLDALVMRNDATTPPLAGALTQDGTGDAYGAQLLIRQELWRNLFGWISYSISRSERRDHPGEPTRLFDFDQTHVLAVVGSWEWRGWSFGARLRYSTGFPRTPVVGAVYDASDARYQPIFGARNSIRIPDFVQLDLRVDRNLRFGRFALDLYLDVQNVTWQKNPEEIVYNFDFSQRGYITGLPTLAVLGARFLF